MLWMLAALLINPHQDRAAAAPAQAQVPRPDAEPDDIVVEGYRHRTERDKRVQSPPNVASTQNQRNYDISARLARCATHSRRADPSRLRAVVDGEINSGAHHVAQDRLVRLHITCGESGELLRFSAIPRSTEAAGNLFTVGSENNAGDLDGAPLGWSIYDRGAFTIAALKRFAPDLKLTKAETNDPLVQQRFILREGPLNRFRTPVDLRYFQVTACMVRLAPELAVRLAMSEGRARPGDLQEAIVDRGRSCVGGARKVRVDPTQFRLYIADAVYRWAVAARGTGSLIPHDREAMVTPPVGTSSS